MRELTCKERVNAKFHIGMASIWNRVAGAYTKGIIYHSRKGCSAIDAKACARVVKIASKKFLKHVSKANEIALRRIES